MFKEVGVEAKVQVLEWAAVFQQVRGNPLNHHMFTLGWVTSNADADYSLYALFHSKQVAAHGLEHARATRTPGSTRCVEQARRSLNQTEREKLYGEVQDILAKEMVWIPVYTTKEIVVTRADVKGFRSTRSSTTWPSGRPGSTSRPAMARRRRRMLTFVLRRLLLAVPVLLGVVFVVMLTIDLLPGDAVTLMLGEHATKEAVARLREHLGLDQPLARPLRRYVGQVVRGDLGRSIQQNRPVAAELADAWPATLQLTVAALAARGRGRRRGRRRLGRVAQLALRRAGAALLALRAVDAGLLDRPGPDRRLLALAQLAAGGRRGLARRTWCCRRSRWPCRRSR